MQLRLLSKANLYGMLQRASICSKGHTSRLHDRTSSVWNQVRAEDIFDIKKNSLIRCAKIDTKKQVFSLVQQIVDDKGIHTTITNGWWERFCHRHPQVTLRTAVPLSIARAMASD